MRIVKFFHLSFVLPLLCKLVNLPFWFGFNCRVIPESARWLISKGRLKEADEIIQRVSQVNGVKLTRSLLDDHEEIQEQPMVRHSQIQTMSRQNNNFKFDGTIKSTNIFIFDDASF